MFSLLKNEWIKLWNRKQTWIFAIAIVVLTIGMALIYNAFDDPAMVDTGEDWETALETEIAEQEAVLESDPEDEWVIQDAERIIEENEEMLAAGINPNDMNNMIFMNETILIIASFVTLFSVIVASSIMSSEIDNGTMKHLLIRPYERWQFLIAKFLTVIGFSISLMAILIAANWLMGTLLFGAGSLSSPVVEMNFETGNMYTTVDSVLPAKVGLYFLNMLMFMIISFSVSILFKSQTLAVGIGIFILFGSTILQGFNPMLADLGWYEYLFLPHLSLQYYATMDEIFPGVTIGFSLTVLAVYAVLFMAACIVLFQKRDLAN